MTLLGVLAWALISRIRIGNESVVRAGAEEMNMLIINCPRCEPSQPLSTTDWEIPEETSNMPLGEHRRIGLVCSKCHREFVLSCHITEVVERAPTAPQGQAQGGMRH